MFTLLVMTKSIILIVIVSAILILFGIRYDTQAIASWHMLNVNKGKLQGDANLILIGDVVIMIDAGYSSEAKANVLPYLKKMNIRKIDHFFISHPHRDHYEGMAPILDAGIQISNLYYKIPSPEVKDCCYDPKDFQKFIQYAKSHDTKLIRPSTGFELDIGTAKIEILHAQEGNLPNLNLDVNDLSLIMKLTLENGASVLFPGDLNKNLGGFLAGDSKFRADFLKMPHHGLAGIAPNAFLDTVDPDFILVPGPKHLWCSERGAQARKWSKKRQIPTWVNGINGNIVVEWKREEVTVIPEITNGECKFKAFGKLTKKIPNDT